MVIQAVQEAALILHLAVFIVQGALAVVFSLQIAAPMEDLPIGIIGSARAVVQVCGKVPLIAYDAIFIGGAGTFPQAACKLAFV